MAGMFERSYGGLLKTAFKAVNPAKKLLIKTECEVHKFINKQSLIILKNDRFINAWQFFDEYIDDLNLGVVWADQGFKSSNHFYSLDNNSGLYGFSNALKECNSYYAFALTYWKHMDYKKSIFYLGAACHLAQDVTVPQHVNIKLLKHHRKYEKWVIKTYDNCDSFKCYDKGIYFNNINDFIKNNAISAIKAYNKCKSIKNLDDRFYCITDVILCQAERSTAGLLYMFYNDINI